MFSYFKRVPPELQKAYNHFEIAHNAIDEEVDAAIIRKLLETRPRDGGNDEEFNKTQTYAMIIKCSRNKSSPPKTLAFPFDEELSATVETPKISVDIDDLIFKRLSNCYKDSPKNLSIIMKLLIDDEINYGRDRSSIWLKYRKLVKNPETTDIDLIEQTELEIDDQISSNDHFRYFFLRMADKIAAKKPQESTKEWLQNCVLSFTESHQKAVDLMNQVPPEIQVTMFAFLYEMKDVVFQGGILKTVENHPKETAAAVIATLVMLPAAISIYQWYNGSISGKRCTKQVGQMGATVVGGVAGGYAGTLAVAAACTNPVTGTIVAGGAICGLLGVVASSYFSDKLLASMLDLPKDQQIENAYNHFDIAYSATDDELDKAIAEKVIETRPRGDEKDSKKIMEFNKTQNYGLMILASRNRLPKGPAIKASPPPPLISTPSLEKEFEIIDVNDN